MCNVKQKGVYRLILCYFLLYQSRDNSISLIKFMCSLSQPGNTFYKVIYHVAFVLHCFLGQNSLLSPSRDFTMRGQCHLGNIVI